MASNLPPEARGLLDAIAAAESNGSWNTIYGGGTFDDYSAHPRQYVPITSGPNKGRKSSAAGKFQILASTYDRVAPLLGITDFTPESQEKIAWYLANEAYGDGLEGALKSGDPAKLAQVGKKLSGVWTSLPSGIETAGTANQFAEGVAAGNKMASPSKSDLLGAWGVGDMAPMSKEDLLKTWSAPKTPSAGGVDRAQFLQQWGAGGGKEMAVAPEGLVPGSAEYAKWAMEQAKAGKQLPQVSEHDVDWEKENLVPVDFTPLERQIVGPDAVSDKFRVKQNSLGDKITAAAGSYIEGAPIIGPAWLDAATNLKSLVSGVPAEELKADFERQKADNPLTSGMANVTGAVVPLLATGGLTATGGKFLGMTGPLAERIGMGALSGGAISGADTLARGGSVEDATHNALMGGALGAALPAAGALLKSAWQGLKGPAAAKVVSQALEADGIAPSEVNALLGKLGPGATMADLGPNMQNLAGGIAAVPGKGQKIIKGALGTRTAEAGQRISDDVAMNLGTGDGLTKATDDLISQQKTVAGPIYDAIRDVQIPMAGDVQAVLQTPMGQKAFRDAATLMANDGQKVNGLTVGLVDYAKRALDDIADVAARKGENNIARQARNLANQLKAGADAAEPRYAQAREAFAGPAGVLDAIESGKDVFTKKMSPADLNAMMGSMTASEKEGLLLGAQSYFANLLGNAKNDARAVADAFKSDFAKEKLALLIGDDAAENIANAIEREAKFAQTSNVATGNSLTAAREETKKLVAPETNQLQAVPQTLTGIIMGALTKARNALTASYRSAQNAKVANLLMSGQISPGGIGAVTRAGAGNALLAPAGVALVDKNRPTGDTLMTSNPLMWKKPPPIEITVNTGNRLLAQ